jgi:hypothetical protein
VLEALTDGYRLAFGIGAVLIGAAIAVALGVLRSPRPAPDRAAIRAETASERA